MNLLHRSTTQVVGISLVRWQIRHGVGGSPCAVSASSGAVPVTFDRSHLGGRGTSKAVPGWFSSLWMFEIPLLRPHFTNPPPATG